MSRNQALPGVRPTHVDRSAVARRGPALLLTTLLFGAVLGTLSALAVASDDGPRVAFVARGDDPADALSLAPLAGRLGAPVLTTPPDRLDPSTRDALRRYDPDLVVVGGGPTAIADGVLAAIRRDLSLDADQVVRVEGDDRYATSAAVIELFADFDVTTPPPAAHVVRVLDADVTATDMRRAVDAFTINAAAGDVWVLRTTVSYTAGEDEDVVFAFTAPDDAAINVTGIGLAPFADSAIGVGRFASDDADAPGVTEINAFGGLGPDADLAADLTATIVMGDTDGPITLAVRQNTAGPVRATVLTGTFLVADRV